MVTQNAVEFRPLTAGRWDDFEALFAAEPGDQRYCWCMFWRLKRADFQRQGAEANRRAMKAVVESGLVPGILAYQQDRPIAWCSIAPRDQFGALERSRRLRRVDDQPVWSIVCFFVAAPYRRRGVSQALVQAAVEHARANGACMVEAYPLAGDHSPDEGCRDYMGSLATFKAAGFKPAAATAGRRLILRLTLS